VKMRGADDLRFCCPLSVLSYFSSYFPYTTFLLLALCTFLLSYFPTFPRSHFPTFPLSLLVSSSHHPEHALSARQVSIDSHARPDSSSKS